MKNYPVMAKKKPSEDRPDDITLLNAHFFPESFAPSALATIKKSKECSLRLDELLKGRNASTRKKKTQSPEQPLAEVLEKPDESSQKEIIVNTQRSSIQDIKNIFKKFIK